MVNWSDLASDVLEHVTSFLPLADQHRFSAVCHNWRIIAKQKLYPPAPQMPWLVLGEDQKTKKRNFFNLSEDRHYSMDIPELYGHYICGSSFGWLITVDKRINGRIINPFTRDCYELPPYPPYEDDEHHITLTEEPVFDSDGNQLGMTFNQMQPMIVRKAVLSHDPRARSDFTAMIVFGSYYALAIWRPGEKSWTIINSRDPLVSFRDVICFKGKFYGISGCDNLYAVDVDSETKVTLLNPYTWMNCYQDVWSYLVDFKGKLLLILRFKKEYEKPTNKFLVYEVDIHKGKCFKREKIHGCAIFVGNNSSVIIDRRTVRGCVGNCIYFTDMCESYFWAKYGHDVGLYNMVSHTVRPYCHREDDALGPPDAALTWLTPNV